MYLCAVLNAGAWAAGIASWLLISDCSLWYLKKGAGETFCCKEEASADVLSSGDPAQSCEQLPCDEEVGRKPKRWQQGILV